jgi:hypothetical protein
MKVKRQFMFVKIAMLHLQSSCNKGNNCKTPLEERVKRFETSKKFNRKESMI